MERQLIHRAVDRWQAMQSHVHYRMRFICDFERELRSLSLTYDLYFINDSSSDH